MRFSKTPSFFYRSKHFPHKMHTSSKRSLSSSFQLLFNLALVIFVSLLIEYIFLEGSLNSVQPGQKFFCLFKELLPKVPFLFLKAVFSVCGGGGGVFVAQRENYLEV